MSYTEAWRADTLLGSVFTQNANRMLGWLRRSRSREVSLPPAPLLSTGGASPGAPSTNLDVLEWVHGGDGQERRLRGQGLGSWSKRKPRGHLVKDLTGRNKDRQGFSQCPLKGQQAMK